MGERGAHRSPTHQGWGMWKPFHDKGQIHRRKDVRDARSFLRGLCFVLFLPFCRRKESGKGMVRMDRGPAFVIWKGHKAADVVTCCMTLRLGLYCSLPLAQRVSRDAAMRLRHGPGFVPFPSGLPTCPRLPTAQEGGHTPPNPEHTVSISFEARFGSSQGEDGSAGGDGGGTGGVREAGRPDHSHRAVLEGRRQAVGAPRCCPTGPGPRRRCPLPLTLPPPPAAPLPPPQPSTAAHLPLPQCPAGPSPTVRRAPRGRPKRRRAGGWADLVSHVRVDGGADGSQLVPLALRSAIPCAVR